MGAVETIEDITESKRAEDALRKSKEDLETKVVERTKQLRNANEQLQSELAERVQTEKALRESETLYRSVVTAMAEGVCLQLASGEIRRRELGSREDRGTLSRTDARPDF